MHAGLLERGGLPTCSLTCGQLSHPSSASSAPGASATRAPHHWGSAPPARALGFRLPRARNRTLFPGSHQTNGVRRPQRVKFTDIMQNGCQEAASNTMSSCLCEHLPTPQTRPASPRRAAPACRPFRTLCSSYCLWPSAFLQG